MYKIIHTTRFKKDLKKFRNNISKTEMISGCIELMESGGVVNVPPQMKPHKLKGFYKDNWECHIQPDLLIIWFQVDEPTKEIRLIRVGKHSELFNS